MQQMLVFEGIPDDGEGTYFIICMTLLLLIKKSKEDLRAKKYPFILKIEIKYANLKSKSSKNQFYQ